MKQSIEVTRFLNHIEREKQKLCVAHKAAVGKISADFNCLRIKCHSNSIALQEANKKIEKLESELAILRPQNESLVESVKSLLPKMRVNIYTGSQDCTPRWFKTGKWWSRETGGLDAEFVSEMTVDEIQEAVEFYGKTELPLMLPKSHRAEIEE